MTITIEQESRKNTFKVLSYVLLLGFMMALGMLFLSFTFDEEVISIDTAQNPDDVKIIIIENESKARLFIMLDTFFIIGYTGLFIGLYLMLRENQETLAKIAFLFGMIVSIGDVMENSLLFALFKGIPKGWDPDPSVYVLLWFLGILVDTCSYVAGILFGTSFMVSNESNKSQRILGILFVSYSFVGVLAYEYAIFVLIRSFFFVVGLFYAMLVFKSESK